MSGTVRSPRLAPLGKTWIPHWALLTGHAAHGLSWVLLLVLASQGALSLSFPGLAWLHLVALGFLTLISLAVLTHVIHGMVDLDWVGLRAARWSLLPYTLGTAGLVLGFWTGQTPLLAGSATVVAASLGVYLSLAFATLARFRPNPEVATALVRAFALVLVCLTLTAGLGLGMAWAIAGHGGSWWLSVAPLMHAHLGVIGWLSLLVVGVSSHTVKPITGGKTDAIWKHIAGSSLLVAGLAVLLVGFATALPALLWAGAAACAAGTLFYLVDMAGILKRSRVPHHPPQAFLAASSVYFALAAALGAGVLAGHTEWQSAYAFTALMGWLTQMVNGHLYHIGIRVLATLARGEDDETRPIELLALPLSWASWGAFQFAVLAGTTGLMAQQAEMVTGAAACGLLGWVLMVANVAHAWRRAHELPSEVAMV